MNKEKNAPGAIPAGQKGVAESAVIKEGHGIRVQKAITINQPREVLYRFWRNLENLPLFMEHLKEVRVLDEKRSHWVAKAPVGQQVEWDAEIINDEPNERVGWRSLEGSQVPNAGAVIFQDAPNGAGTLLQVELKYEPPAGALGRAMVKIFGEEPSRQVQEDLRHLKQMLETGETPTTEGQPSGRKQVKARNKDPQA